MLTGGFDLFGVAVLWGFGAMFAVYWVGGGLVLLGTVLFAVGYTRAQWALREATRAQERADEREQRYCEAGSAPTGDERP